MTRNQIILVIVLSIALLYAIYWYINRVNAIASSGGGNGLASRGILFDSPFWTGRAVIVDEDNVESRD